MKILTRNSTSKANSSHDMILATFVDEKVKMTYSVGNSYERCEIKVYSHKNKQWNLLFSLNNLGYSEDRTMYICKIDERTEKADMLFKKAEKLCKKLFDN